LTLICSGSHSCSPLL